MGNGRRKWHLCTMPIFTSELLFKINLCLLLSKHSVFSVNPEEIFAHSIGCWWNAIFLTRFTGCMLPWAFFCFCNPCEGLESDKMGLLTFDFPVFWLAYYLPLLDSGTSEFPAFSFPAVLFGAAAAPGHVHGAERLGALSPQMWVRRGLRCFSCCVKRCLLLSQQEREPSWSEEADFFSHCCMSNRTSYCFVYLID